MRTRIAGIIIALSIMAGAAQAATTSGTVDIDVANRGSLTRYLVHWTSDALGNVVDDSIIAHGYLKRVSILSGTAGIAPTTAYDFTIKDDMGYDVCRAAGSNVVTSTPSTTVPVDATTSRSLQVAGRLDLAIAAAGDTKQGWIALYFDTYDMSN